MQDNLTTVAATLKELADLMNEFSVDCYAKAMALEEQLGIESDWQDDDTGV